MRALGKRTLKEILELLRDLRDGADQGLNGRRIAERLVLDVERALGPRRGAPQRRKTKRAARAEKNEETADLYAAVMKRAGFTCETTDENGVRCTGIAYAMDHFFGKAKWEQGLHNCWALCFLHNRLKTDNVPDSGFWLHRFVAHCDRYGYAEAADRARARLHLVDARRAFA